MNLNWYTYLFSYYAKSRLFNIKRPVLAGVKITNACNLKCRHCPFWRMEEKSLSFSQVKESFKNLYDIGIRLLIIEGGEPFLWKDDGYDIRNIVKEAREFFFSVGITTNGTFPLEVDSDIIWISIDGLKKTHDLIRGETFEKIIANIEASSHEKIYAHITINSLNWKEVPDLVAFLSSKVKGITIQFHYLYNGLEDKLFLPHSERKKILDNLINMKRNGFPIANSCACLQALKDNRWKCHSWMIASVGSDSKITQGCYVKNRGEISCERCGFSAHTEISLAYSGVIESLRVGNKIFDPKKRKQTYAQS
ncbi:radical SAM protein [Candidatus Latescibacterota bacterium]